MKKKKKATKIFSLLQSIKQCVPCTNRDPFKHSRHAQCTYAPRRMPILCFPVHRTLTNVGSPLHTHPENGAPDCENCPYSNLLRAECLKPVRHTKARFSDEHRRGTERSKGHKRQHLDRAWVWL